MDAQIHETPSLAQRLAPIAQGLATGEYRPDEFDAAAQELRGIASALSDAQAQDWSAAALVLSDLAEIAACSITDWDGGERGRLVDCIAEGVALLREVLLDPDSAAEQLDWFLETARSDWSDCLAVVDADEADQIDEFAVVRRNRAETVDVSRDDSVELSPSPDEVQMILGALSVKAAAGRPALETSFPDTSSVRDTTPFGPAREGPPAAADRAAKDPFNSSSRESRKPAPPPLPAVDDVVLDPELQSAYLCDAEECLAAMEQAVLEFESGGGESAVQQLCRELHTLKGASASVGLTNLAEYLHRVEELLERAEYRSEVGPPRHLDAVLSCIDVVREWVTDRQTPQGNPARSQSPRSSSPDPPQAADEPARPQDEPLAADNVPPAENAKPADIVSPADSGAASAARGGADDSLRVKASQVDRLLDLLADLVMLRSRRDRQASQLGAIREELQACVARLHAVSHEAKLQAYRTSSATSAMPRRADKGVGHGAEERPPLSSAVDPRSFREGQLAEVSDDLTEVARSLKELHDPLVEESRAVSQFIRQFRHELMELRRLPVAGLFRRLRRAVRDAARVENKQVRLQMIGEHAGLERSVQEKLYEPLLHLVRNAVSHGIESEGDRIRAGKAAVGTITLEALGSAQLLVLEIRDDGRGLDYEAIRRRGVERGLIAADQQSSRSQLAQLIFHPGFSTREQANAVAGRGVGMDVVASTLRRMHARVDVESEPGQGTTIRLRIPLHSVIEHTMLFRCGGQLFALPVQSVRAASEDEWASHRTGLTESGSVRNSAATADRRSSDNTDSSAVAQGSPAVPIRLAQVFGLPQGTNPNGGHCLVLRGSNLPSSNRSGREDGGNPSTSGGSSAPRAVAVIVDEILGPDEVVVRSLPPLLRRHPLLAGATLSAGGDIVQLLDSERVVELCLRAIEPASVKPGPEGDGRPQFGPAGADTRPARAANAEATSPFAAIEPDSEGPALKVLIVDDSLSARRSLIQKLRPRGFELHEAGNGFEALDHLRAERFDIVFSDLEMPRMGGFDLLAEIRSKQNTRSLPVVIVTTRNEPEHRARADELGSDGYLTKPVSAPELERVLERLEIARNRTPD